MEAHAETTPLTELDHEGLVVRRGRRSGVYTIVAVHSTKLGPALGGCRMWRYAGAADATRDALRLGRAMTFKAAAAQVPLGGGKCVICAPPGGSPDGERRRAMLLDFADTVNALDGAYITAEDVGTSSADMIVIRERTAHVAGLPESHDGSGDPSPVTALGVEAAMRACCERRFGSPDLEGRTVSIVGVGRVGSQLARRLSEAGAQLLLADIDERRRALVDELPGSRWCDPNVALQAEVDVLAPCALGGAINESTVDRLRCAIVCGSANNQLSHEGLAEDLDARDILYAPDFVANAGGLINCAVERDGYDRDRALEWVRGIEDTIGELLDEAEATGMTPLAAAFRLARRRLDEADLPAGAVVT